MTEENNLFGELQYIRGRVDEIYTKLETKTDKDFSDKLEERVRQTEQSLARQGFLGVVITCISTVISSILGFLIWLTNK